MDLKLNNNICKSRTKQLSPNGKEKCAIVDYAAEKDHSFPFHRVVIQLRDSDT